MISNSPPNPIGALACASGWYGTILVAGVLALAGCAGNDNSRGYARYVPAAPTARRALEEALDAWQQQQPVETAGPGGPTVQVIDSHRRPGQRLESYKVLGEVMAGDGPRCFAVRLYLAEPREEKKVNYCVLGLDPLWVFRQDDYEMITHWECADPEGKTAVAPLLPKKSAPGSPGRK